MFVQNINHLIINYVTLKIKINFGGLFSSTCVFQGYESRPGKKDPSKIYTEVALLEGMDQIRCLVNADLIDKVLPGLTQFSICKCQFELNVRYNTLTLTGIAPVK